MVQVLNRIQNAKPITIKQIAAETNRIIQEQNAKIISLAQGTPNLPIFQSAHDAMVQLIDTNKMPYTDVQGLLSVRQTASQFINQMFFFHNHDNHNQNHQNNNSENDHNNVVYSPENVIITAGAVQAVYNVLALSIESENDVVVSPLPAYGLYKHQTELLGGTFVPVETHESHQFIPTVDSLRTVFDQYQQQIKSIVLCYPNNPVGSNLSQQQAKELAQFLDEQLQLTNDGFSIILDEVYFGIVNHNNNNNSNNNDNNNNTSSSTSSSDQSLSTTSSYRQHVSILQYASTRVLNNSFLILSASKGLGAMPGMRCGFCCCYDQRLVQCMTNIQMACSANASICSQEGLRASLQYIMDHPIQSLVQQVSRSYSERTELVVQRLNQLGRMYGCHVTKETGRELLVVARVPSATFYVFVNFSELLPDEFGVKTDEQIQQFFRDMYIHGSRKTGVACVPGVAFGMNPTQKLIRFSCAVEMNDLVEAMDIIQEAVEMILVKRVLLNQ